MKRRLGLCALLAGGLLPGLGPGATAGPELTWGPAIEVAAAAARRGPWRMNESDYDYVDDPTVAVNAHGLAGVAWADQARKDVFFQLYGPDGRPRLPAPVNVSRTPRVFSWLPRLVLSATDPVQVAVLWQEIVFSGGSHGGDIFFARSTDGGRTFSDPLNLSTDPAGSGKGRLTARLWHNGSLDLAAGPGGAVYAAWTDYEGPLWFSRSGDGGRTFSPPVRLGGDPAGPARGPGLAVDGAGAVYLAWTAGEARAAAVRVARSTDEGRSFGPPLAVGDRGEPDAPRVATDARGTVHLVYGEGPAGPRDRPRVRYTRSDDGGRTFAPPVTVSGSHGERFDAVGFPGVAVDGRGTVYVGWDLFPRRGHQPQGLGFSWSRDGGRTFAPPALVPGSVDPAGGFNGSQQGLLMRKLAAGDRGPLAVVTSTFRSGAQSRIRLLVALRPGP